MLYLIEIFLKKMIELKELSLNLEKSNIKDSNYNVVEEGLSNL